MPKSRKISKKNKSLWAKIAALFAVLFVTAWVLMPKGEDSVLGVSTSNLFGANKTSGTGTGGQTGCKPMLSAISFSNPCIVKGSEPGFKNVTYTCGDGTIGSSTSTCLQPQQAFEKAGKTCSKKSNCKPPKISGTQMLVK